MQSLEMKSSSMLILSLHINRTGWQSLGCYEIAFFVKGCLPLRFGMRLRRDLDPHPDPRSLSKQRSITSFGGGKSFFCS